MRKCVRSAAWPAVFHDGVTRSLKAASLALAAVAVAGSGAAGQPSLAVSAGAAPYDLSGTGTSGIAAARLGVPLATWLEAEAGTAFFWYTTQSSTSTSMLIPEVGARAFVPGTPLYAAAGVGHTLLVRGDWPEEVALYLGVGLEIEDRAGWALRPEVRLHNIDPWAATIAEISFGVRRRFGPA